MNRNGYGGIRVEHIWSVSPAVSPTGLIERNYTALDALRGGTDWCVTILCR